ncbi:surface antigen BspA-like [Trichomonas vaginalis G3]|uniref:Surface antigen BspA-like n=1 Tax=Trichomonas vaginalis (strain ATCC PRA-98 / G3) TaxID=412133 RepID=A2ETT8_TRIV3|nr:structural constituent of cell wall [Trichomonas vaginalis G3]EAY03969.1 surface antigen BspA-like [Trichomonas vaginalis G3]KAI5541014.1 structural constituent of cell wall [Trichomonas vaginalis G3]|eukprot:XP_001316192.1 surface antigen BspA-like [Trichomonas vaginalis G3]
MLFTNKKKTLSGYFGTDPNKNLVVPDGLTEIGLGTFIGKKLKSISFNGATLNNINIQAFQSSSIESISLPSSLSSIGRECFANCVNLKTVTFDRNSPLTVISMKCFENCKLLENIILPSSITTIQEYAFSGCSKIGDIGLSSTQISNIDTYAFKNSGITILDNAHNEITFGYGSFYESSIETITFRTVTIPSNCFFGCSSLTSINIVSVDTIEDSSFENCVSLAAFVIPSSLRIVKSFAFRSCLSLSSVTLSIDSHIDQIYGGAFINCPNLQSIKLDSKDNRYRFSNGALTNYEETNLITFIPSSRIDTYIVPVTMTSIGNYAFMSCPNLVRVLFSGNSIQTIGRESFKDCPKLSFLYVTSSSLTSIGESAFDGSPLLRRCGSVRCDKSKRDMFISNGIPTISFKVDCSYAGGSCGRNPTLISNLSPILITPLIVM